MVPLLFLKPAKVEIPKEDLEAGWMTTVKLRFYDSHVIHFFWGTQPASGRSRVRRRIEYDFG
jgi:hypothetical protein